MGPPPAGAGGAVWNEEIQGAKGAVAVWKVHAVLTFVQFSISGAIILNKVAFTGGINPLVFTVFADIVGVVCISPVAFFTERLYFTQLTTSYGLALAPAAYGCLIGITIPIFVFILSVASGLEEVKWTRRSGLAKVAGVMSAVCGGILIPLYNGPVIIFRGTHVVPLSELPLDEHSVVAPTFLNLNIGDSMLGGFLLVLCGFFAAVYWAIQAKLLRRYPAPISIAAISRIIALLLMTVTGLVTVKDPSAWRISRLSDIITIVYGGVIAGGLTFAIQCWAAFESGPVLLASYKPLQSVTTIGMSYLFLGDNIFLGSILGLVCIVNGLYLITWGKVASQKEAGHPVKALPSTLHDVSIVKSESDLERRLLG